MLEQEQMAIISSKTLSKMLLSQQWVSGIVLHTQKSHLVFPGSLIYDLCDPIYALPASVSLQVKYPELLTVRKLCSSMR